MWLLATVAWADDPETPPDPAPEAPPETVDLGGDEPLESALDDFDDKAAESRADRTSVGSLASIPMGLGRGRWSVRPQVSAAVLRGRGTWAARVGLSVERQWFPLTDALVQVGGAVALSADFPIGAAFGRRLEAVGQVGPWLGPVGLRIGPAVRWDRITWRRGAPGDTPATLPDALLVGARASLTVELGRVSPMVGVEPAWAVLGDRVAPEDPLLPVLGTETAWMAGINWLARPVTLGLRATWRETAIGAELDTFLMFGIKLL